MSEYLGNLRLLSNLSILGDRKNIMFGLSSECQIKTRGTRSYLALLCIRPKKIISLVRVTLPYLTFLVKPNFFIQIFCQNF